jgi:NAD(P)-dependent dehydrogenase (short-subunit alcohol dehydrogenase family)
MPTVIVTGANRGIGRTIALTLAARGSAVVGVGRSHPEELESLKTEILAKGGRCVTVTADLADALAPRTIVDAAIRDFGRLDAIVSNAVDLVPPRPLLESTADRWDRGFAVNLRASMLLAQVAEPHLKAAHGSFIAIGSTVGCEPAAYRGVYGATKAGLVMLVRGLAQRWAEDGVRANCVSPGQVHTTMSEFIFSNPVRAEQRLRLIPLGRIGRPEDTANTVAWLLSPAARHVTGQNLIVDGAYLGSVQAHTAGEPMWRRAAKDKEKQEEKA